MSSDTRTETEKRYDAIRDGSTYQPTTQLSADASHAEITDEIIRIAQDIIAHGPLAEDQAALLTMMRVAGRLLENPKRQLGTIVDIAVYACDDHNDHECYGAEMQWNGLRLDSDGEDWINLGPEDDVASVGDISLPRWAQIVELVQSGVAEQLIRIARANRGPLAA